MDDLFAATFPSTNNFGFINCSSKPSPVQGIIAKVPSIKGVEPGDVLTLFSQGYTSFDDKTPYYQEQRLNLSDVIGPADVGQPWLISSSGRTPPRSNLFVRGRWVFVIR